MKPVLLRSLPISLACLGLGLLTLGGCNRPNAASSDSQASQGEAPTVTTLKPARKSLRRIIEQPAFVEAFEETPLMAKLSGYVQKVHVDMGDRVKGPRFDDTGIQMEPGQVLAELWVPEMEEELQEKKARVDQAEAQLKLAHESVKAAEAEQNRLKSQFERFTKAGAEILQGEILEETRYAFEVTKAKWGMANAEVGVRKTRVEVAKAEHRRLSALLEYSKVRAPYDGVITSRNIHTGYYLTGTGAKPLFVIARTDIVRIMVDVPEAYATSVSDGIPARIRCQMITDQEFEGKVTRSSWSLDAKSRTLRTEVDLPNPQTKLRPGMYAYARIEAKLPEAWVLPSAALLKQGDTTICFVVESGKAVRLPVQVGRSDAGFTEVLKKQKSGTPSTWLDFNGDEVIVTNATATLSDGQAVRVSTTSPKR